MAETKQSRRWTGWVATIAAMAMVVAFLVVFDARPAHAQLPVTITVDTLHDVVNNRDGLCSLREAIVSANTNTTSGPIAGECVAGGSAFVDVIDFSVSGMITLTGTVLPIISTSMAINGAGITLNGDSLSRVFQISGGFVTLRDLVIEDGAAVGDGGAVWIYSTADVTIEGSAVVDSTATGEGGGIHVGGLAGFTLLNSGVYNNTGETGGISIYNSLSHIVGSTILNNVGTGTERAGAIYHHGTLNITDSFIGFNEATGPRSAGAIEAGILAQTVITNTSINDNLNSGTAAFAQFTVDGGAELTLSGVTVANNDSPLAAVGGADELTIINSTISSNESLGIEVANDDLTMTFSTVTANTGGGLGIDFTSMVTIGASIIATNGAFQVYGGPNLGGSFTSEGFNVIGGVSDDSAGGIVNFEWIHDETSVASSLIALGPLANNGGLTLTHQPGDGSIAIDRVTRPVSNEPAADARGTARPQGPARDSGAVEVVNGVASCEGVIPTINMNTNGGNGTGTPGTDWILGTPGADVINGAGGDDVICGGDGDDVIRSGAGNDWIFGEGGNDVLRGGGGSDNILGGVENDQIFGQGGSDDLFGGPGDDEMHGLGAADTLEGGTGNDTMSGQNGGDAMLGEAGDDVFRGHTGPDTLIGGAGDDDLFGGNGADTLLGGDGIDKCAGNSGPDSAQASSCESTPGVENLF